MRYRLPRGGLFLYAALLLLCAAPAAAQQGTDLWLDISLARFDSNMPEDPQQRRRQGIYPQVREAEARYIPAYLRMLLVESGQWGAVRILPEADPGAELMITGTIVDSDGAMLELAVRATDSTGRTWIDTRYQGEAITRTSLNQPALDDPFLQVYQRILADLQAAREQLPAGEIRRIQQTALLRYAAGLAPEAFAGYLEQGEDGRYQYTRLPAANDPLLQRVQRIRQHEYLFVDVVDEQYRDFFRDIKPVYDLWRDYRQEELETSTGFEARQAEGGSDFRPGSYRALRASYNNYRWAKMQDQYLDEIATGFSNETEATDIELENQLYELTGTMQEQYREWREILRELYDLDAGGDG